MKNQRLLRYAGTCGGVVAALALTACGGGGGGKSNAAARAVPLQPTTYVVFEAGEQATASGAGAVTTSGSSSKLALGAGGETTLTATSGSTFAVTANNTDYQVVNRRDGAVLMLCDPLSSGSSPGDTHANYVAIATNSASADTQGTPVTNALELAGKSFYVMGECSYLDDSQSVQGANAAPNGATLEYRFDASGNLRGSNGWSVDAATFTGFLNGGFYVDPQGRKVWFSAYKFTVGNEQKIYFATRVEPLQGDQGYIGLWTDDASSDVVGCSLNCAKPADAVATTNANAVAGIYVTQYGFGEEASLVWVNSAGQYAYGLATAASSQVNAGLETGTLAFDSSGTLTATKLHDTNGPGEAIMWNHNATQVGEHGRFRPGSPLHRRACGERSTEPAHRRVGAGRLRWQYEHQHDRPDASLRGGLLEVWPLHDSGYLRGR